MDARIAKSGGVSLRVPQFEDMDFIQQLWADPETMAPVGGPVYLSNDEALEWFARMVDPGSPGDCYRLILDPDGSPVGEVSFHRLDMRTMTAELNIKIRASSRGNGYATEALYLLLDHFFNELGGQAVIDDLSKQNVVGQDFLCGFGFEEEPCSDPVRRFKMTAEMFNAIA